VHETWEGLVSDFSDPRQAAAWWAAIGRARDFSDARQAATWWAAVYPRCFPALKASQTSMPAGSDAATSTTSVLPVHCQY